MSIELTLEDVGVAEGLFVDGLESEWVGHQLIGPDLVFVETDTGGALTDDLDPLEGSREALKDEQLEGVGEKGPQVDVIFDDVRESGFNRFDRHCRCGK
jgi:hypothetical protein